jgi:glycosyltransferase involved in cell wall biosynthesis
MGIRELPDNPGKMKYSILHTEWSCGWGGQEQRIILECRKMQELGHKVLIACQPGSGILEKARDNGIRVEEVVIRGSYDLRAVRDICRIIRKNRITVVNTHSGKDTWVGGFAARLIGVDLLVRTRHLSIPISNNPFNFIHRLYDGIITTGESIRSTMITVNGITPNRIVSIATGVSLERFNPSLADGMRVRKELEIPDHCPVVTMVAVMRSMKRHDLLVRVAELLQHDFPDVRFLVVGEGPGQAKIEGLVSEAGLAGKVILTGYRSDIADIFAASDLVILTSDRFEGVPQSLSQAMAMERPVVAAPVGSISELVVNNRTGLLAEAGNAESFTAAVTRLLADGNLRAELGLAARQHVLQHFTDEIMADKTINFYNYLLALKKKYMAE